MYNKNKKKRVLIISIGFVLDSNPSDKQFVSDLIRNISSDFEIAVWSLNDAYPVRKKVRIGEQELLYENVNRVFHKSLFDDEKGMYCPHARHTNLRNFFEINISIIWYLFTKIRKLLKKYKPDVVHLTDSIGPSTIILKYLLNEIPLTITKPTVRLDGHYLRFIYKVYTKFSLKTANKIITFTNAASEQLSYREQRCSFRMLAEKHMETFTRNLCWTRTRIQQPGTLVSTQATARAT